VVVVVVVVVGIPVSVWFTLSALVRPPAEHVAVASLEKLNPAAPIARAFVLATWNTNVIDWVGLSNTPSATVPIAAQTVLLVVGPPPKLNLWPLAVAIVLSAASPAKSVPRAKMLASLYVIDPLPPSPEELAPVGIAVLITYLTCPMGIRLPVATEELAVAALPETAPVAEDDATDTGFPSAAAIVVALNDSAFESSPPPTTSAPYSLLLPRAVKIPTAPA
jgi:hypothetical protein